MKISFCYVLQKRSMKIRFLLQRAQNLTARQETADGDNLLGRRVQRNSETILAGMADSRV